MMGAIKSTEAKLPYDGGSRAREATVGLGVGTEDEFSTSGLESLHEIFFW